MHLPTKVSSTEGQLCTRNPINPTLGFWLVGANRFLALRMTLPFKWWRVEGPSGLGHTHGNSGSRDSLLLSDLLKSPVRLSLRARRIKLCSMNPLHSLGPSGLCTRTHHPEEPTLATSDQDTSLSLSWELMSSAQFSSLQSDMSARLSGPWCFPSVRPLACCSYGSLAEHTNLSFRGLWSGQRSLIQETLVLGGYDSDGLFFLHGKSLSEASEPLKQ